MDTKIYISQSDFDKREDKLLADVQKSYDEMDAERNFTPGVNEVVVSDETMAILKAEGVDVRSPYEMSMKEPEASQQAVRSDISRGKKGGYVGVAAGKRIQWKKNPHLIDKLLELAKQHIDIHDIAKQFGTSDKSVRTALWRYFKIRTSFGIPAV
jgi:hypothetical protein